ncbi:MAG: TonB-dependent receptor plug domain-containing protein [Acidobacteria bacterium]|nr:TonB-dependent receptor plug domain-containing protein [Acidobacteriota bacterium]
MFTKIGRRMRGTSGSYQVVLALLASSWLYCLPTASAQGPHTLSGTVTDPSGAVIGGATVSLHARDGGFRRSTLTDKRGTYSLAAVAAGEYVLEIAGPDLFRSVSRAVVIDSKAPAQADMTLQLDQLRTEVVVTASTTPLTLDQTAKALSTVDRAHMDARNEYSIAESLRPVPGLRVLQQRGPGGNTAIQIRGMRSGDTAVLLDGFRLRDAAATDGSGSGLLQDLMVVNTERVEVLRGSGSTSYGSGSTGGAVNVMTDYGGGRPHGEILGEGGGLGFARGLARFGGGALEERLNYSLGLAHLNVRDGIDGQDAYRNSTAHGAVQVVLSPSATLSGRIMATDSFLQLNDSGFVPADAEAGLPSSGAPEAIALPVDQQRLAEAGRPFQLGNANFISDPNDPDNRRSSSLFAGSMQYTQQLGPRGSFRVGYQGLDTEGRFDDGPAGIQFEPQFNNSSGFRSRIHTLQSRSDWALSPSQLFSFGYEFEQETYDSPSSDENPDAAQRVNVSAEGEQRHHAVFAQDQFRWLDSRLQLSLGGRVEAFRLAQPGFSGGASPYGGIELEAPKTAYTGDVAASYHFSGPGTKVRAHVGNAFKAPSLFQRFGSSFFFGSFSPFGDPRLSPERTVAFDAGIDQWLAGDRARLSATYFYTRLQEVIIFDFSGVINPATDPFGRFGGYRNTGGGLARGVEISLSAAPSRRTDVTASYTYTNADEATSSVVARNFFKTFNVSDHMFTVNVLQRFGRRVDVAFDLFAASGYATPFFTSLGTRAFLFEGPLKADVTASYTWPVSDRKSVKLFGKLENVLDREYFEAGFRSPGIWGTVGLSFGF